MIENDLKEKRENNSKCSMNKKTNEDFCSEITVYRTG